MTEDKKFLKQWRSGNEVYYFYDDDAHEKISDVDAAVKAIDLEAVKSETLEFAKNYTDDKVKEKIDALIGDDVSETMDTLKELGELITNNKDTINNLNTLVNEKANTGDVYNKTVVDEKIADVSSRVVDLEDIAKANKMYATIKSVPSHGVVTDTAGNILKKKSELLVSKDGIPYSNGLGQVIFNVKMEDGYKSTVSVKGDEGYKNIKEEAQADGSVQYKITKIHDEIEINISEAEITEEPNGYRVDFVGEHFSVKYLAEDKNVDSATDVEINGTDGIVRTYTRDYDNGGVYAKYSAAIVDDPSTPDIDETAAEVKPQVQFIVIPEEGYRILSVVPSPGAGEGFKNDKSGMNGTTYVYKYTVIKTDLTVAITTGPASKTLADYYITDAYTKAEADEKFVTSENVYDKTAADSTFVKTETVFDSNGLFKTSKTTGDATAMIFNESDGGGAMFSSPSLKSFAGVHNGNDDICAQVYAKDPTTNEGARLNVSKSGIYYSVGSTSEIKAENELATKKDIIQPPPMEAGSYCLTAIRHEDGSLEYLWEIVPY